MVRDTHVSHTTVMHERYVTLLCVFNTLDICCVCLLARLTIVRICKKFLCFLFVCSLSLSRGEECEAVSCAILAVVANPSVTLTFSYYTQHTTYSLIITILIGGYMESVQWIWHIQFLQYTLEGVMSRVSNGICFALFYSLMVSNSIPLLPFEN